MRRKQGTAGGWNINSRHIKIVILEISISKFPNLQVNPGQAGFSRVVLMVNAPEISESIM